VGESRGPNGGDAHRVARQGVQGRLHHRHYPEGVVGLAVGAQVATHRHPPHVQQPCLTVDVPALQPEQLRRALVRALPQPVVKPAARLGVADPRALPISLHGRRAERAARTCEVRGGAMAAPHSGQMSSFRKD
jgi:hypothetical protein